MKWSPDGTKIVIWDGSHPGKLGIYLISGSKLAVLTDVFGIHSLEWSPTAQILAVATVGCKVETSFNLCFVTAFSKKIFSLFLTVDKAYQSLVLECDFYFKSS